MEKFKNHSQLFLRPKSSCRINKSQIYLVRLSLQRSEAKTKIGTNAFLRNYSFFETFLSFFILTAEAYINIFFSRDQ